MSTSTKVLGKGKDRANYLLSALEEDILTVLLGRTLYGLLISQAIFEASAGVRDISVGSLYPTLRRLEKKGFVKSTWEGSADTPIEVKERGGARRRYYQITSHGKKILLENKTVRENLSSWTPSYA